MRVRVFSLLFRCFPIWGLAILSACSSYSPQTTTDVSDGAPLDPVDVSGVPDAIPRHEIRTIAGNKSPYTVLGKTYQVLPDSLDYHEDGIASWYGTKFHGRATSNGETYDMYGMTAAHKTLPIPSYVRVTNLENGRQVVVRINDRGPFHDDRLIDLSYAAAGRLGYLDQGTARVSIEALDTASLQVAKATQSSELPKVNNAPTFLQVGAFSDMNAAEALQVQLRELTPLPVNVVSPEMDRLYRVRIGPISDDRLLTDTRLLLQQHRFPSAFVIYD